LNESVNDLRDEPAKEMTGSGNNEDEIESVILIAVLMMNELLSVKSFTKVVVIVEIVDRDVVVGK
jgi:hypothetical protein